MTQRRHIVIATCRRWPDFSVGDAPLATELSRRGHAVTASPWNVAPLWRFTSADMVVLRSNWDFHYDLPGFEGWLSVVDESQVELHNDAELVRTYSEKSYLERLRADGVRTPRTLAAPSFDGPAIGEWVDENGFERVVIKPVWGASGHLVELVTRAELQEVADRWNSATDVRGVLVQEFVPEIAGGEHALVFFGGQYSHALLRRPPEGEFRVNSQYGGRMQLASDVDPTLIDFAAGVLQRLPVQPTYARVDVVAADSGPVLMELELNEPALGLHLAPGSEVRFANALLGD